jgi:hypothetical protein
MPNSKAICCPSWVTTGLSNVVNSAFVNHEAEILCQPQPLGMIASLEKYEHIIIYNIYHKNS